MEAHQILGVCYEYGIGVEKDKKKAAEWWVRVAEGYQKAAEQGDAEAQYQVRFTMRGNPKYD